MNIPAYHMFYLLLCNKVQLELLEEEVGDETIHLDGLGVLGEPLRVVIHQGHEPVPGRSVVTLKQHASVTVSSLTNVSLSNIGKLQTIPLTDAKYLQAQSKLSKWGVKCLFEG